MAVERAPTDRELELERKLDKGLEEDEERVGAPMDRGLGVEVEEADLEGIEDFEDEMVRVGRRLLEGSLDWVRVCRGGGGEELGSRGSRDVPGGLSSILWNTFGGVGREGRGEGCGVGWVGGRWCAGK